jgi:hypothetical protein
MRWTSMKTIRWMLRGWLIAMVGLAQAGSLSHQSVAALNLAVARLQEVAAPPATTRLAPAVAADATKPAAVAVITQSSRWVALSAITAVLAAIALAARRRVVFGKRS